MVARCSRSLYLRSKMPHCVAFECNTQAKNKKKDPRIRFHKFPDDEKRRQAWFHAVGRTSLPKDPRLCSKHFEEHCFEESYLVELRLMGSSKSLKSLKPDAIPTIFAHKPSKSGTCIECSTCGEETTT